MEKTNVAGQAILNGIPEELRARLRKQAMEAPTSYRAAVMLKCLDCCAWDRKEVKRCHITACSLHAIRDRLFNYVSKEEQLRRREGKAQKQAESA